ncbi:unnamed protein product [Orchesella dallaii]|uniref:Uncharacterized protein n=1 Tax=Orchesella dallaii TaxID=48710 RepID=A0ABP1S9S1_9HEXA
MFIVNYVMAIAFPPNAGFKFVNITSRFNTFVSAGRTRYFLNSTILFQDDGNFKPEDVAIGVIEAVLEVVQYLIMTTSFIIFIIPFPLWNEMKLFVSSIHRSLTKTKINYGDNSVEKEVDKWLDRWEELKSFSDSTNSAFSIVVLFWLFEYVIITMVLLNDVLRLRKLIPFILIIGSPALVTLSLVVGAEICRLVDCCKEHIQTLKTGKNTTAKTEKELDRLLSRFEAAPVGIGSTGVYMLSYGFLAQLLCSMVITMFIISFP